jgi:Tol biopolymer transport system component
VYEPSTLTYLDGWSRDGAWLAGHVGGSAGPGILIPLAEGGKPILFEDNSKETGVDEARFSPDGRWLAYSLATPSSVDTFLIPLPPTGERWRVSVAGGVQPRWRADGRALYFLSMSGTMMMVDFEARAGAPPQISAPRALFETGIQVLQGFDQFAVNRDGTRFLIRRLDDRETMMQNRLQVIVNWPGLLKKTQ